MSFEQKKRLTQEQQSILASEFEKKKKSKLITFLLWFFFGALGIHRFYIGDTGLGIAMLLLGWLTLGIWPFIDGIYVLVKRVDVINENIEQDIINQVIVE